MACFTHYKVVILCDRKWISSLLPVGQHLKMQLVYFGGWRKADQTHSKAIASSVFLAWVIYTSCGREVTGLNGGVDRHGQTSIVSSVGQPAALWCHFSYISAEWEQIGLMSPSRGWSWRPLWQVPQTAPPSRPSLFVWIWGLAFAATWSNSPPGVISLQLCSSECPKQSLFLESFKIIYCN